MLVKLANVRTELVALIKAKDTLVSVNQGKFELLIVYKTFKDFLFGNQKSTNYDFFSIDSRVKIVKMILWIVKKHLVHRVQPVLTYQVDSIVNVHSI